MEVSYLRKLMTLANLDLFRSLKHGPPTKLISAWFTSLRDLSPNTMSDPNIQTIDLASVRETCPNPTCDVKFLIVNQNTGEETEVLAHKLILSFGSPVFMRQFYGTMKEEKDSIPVKDSSVEAFRICKTTGLLWILRPARTLEAGTISSARGRQNWNFECELLKSSQLMVEGSSSQSFREENVLKQ